MLKPNRLILLCLCTLSFAGCAVGNNYDYKRTISLPVVGDESLGLAVIDKRNYILSGKKPKNFIGIQRGGFGNPFNVTTASGEPLAKEFAAAIENALLKNGFQIKSLALDTDDPSKIRSTILSDGASKNIILRINEWKTDSMMKLRLLYDLELDVFDKQGNVLARATDQGDEVISGAGSERGNSQNAATAFENKIGRLFNTPQLRSVFEN